MGDFKAGLSAMPMSRIVFTRNGKKMRLRAWLFLIALALPAGSVAIADPLTNGTKEERKACAPEAVRFCNHELDVNASDTAAILKCLQRNRLKISAACQTVLKNHGE
jgi:hypothetical protein